MEERITEHAWLKILRDIRTKHSLEWKKDPEGHEKRLREAGNRLEQRIKRLQAKRHRMVA